MVLSWETRENHREKRRSVERDFVFYDNPSRVLAIINRQVWPYKNNSDFLHLRDLAFMSLLYLGSFRASEICRAELACGSKPSIKRIQFIVEKDFVKLRDVIILKRREPVLDENGNKTFDEHGKPVYQVIQKLENYPKRKEIKLPRRGSLSIFTEIILSYIELLGPYDELFPFKYIRAYQIVEYCTWDGEMIKKKDGSLKRKRGHMSHYLRDMGLKLHSRLTDRNLKELQEYSGHARLENLTKYLGEGRLEKALLSYKE